MFLEDECDRAAEAWLSIGVGREDARFGMRQGIAADGSDRDGAEPSPGAGDFAYDKDGIRCQAIDEHSYAQTQIVGHAFERLASARVVLLS
jgi:hypothetical protein